MNLRVNKKKGGSEGLKVWVFEWGGGESRRGGPPVGESTVLGGGKTEDLYALFL